MEISILNRFSASVIFAADIENNTVKLTLELALKSSVLKVKKSKNEHR